MGGADHAADHDLRGAGPGGRGRSRTGQVDLRGRHLFRDAQRGAGRRHGGRGIPAGNVWAGGVGGIRETVAGPPGSRPEARDALPPAVHPDDGSRRGPALPRPAAGGAAERHRRQGELRLAPRPDPVPAATPRAGPAVLAALLGPKRRACSSRMFRLLESDPPRPSAPGVPAPVDRDALPFRPRSTRSPRPLDSSRSRPGRPPNRAFQRRADHGAVCHARVRVHQRRRPVRIKDRPRCMRSSKRRLPAPGSSPGCG